MRAIGANASSSLLLLFPLLGDASLLLGIKIHHQRRKTAEQRRVIDDIEASGGRVWTHFGGHPYSWLHRISSKTRFSWLTLVVLGLPNSPICDNSRG